MVEHPHELSPQQRAALLVYHLCALGRRYTTAEVAAALGLTPRGALYLLERLSGVLPIVQDGQRWMWVTW